MSSPFVLGTLARGSTQITGTANPVYAGNISTAKEGFVSSHVKLLDESGFFIESVCAWILQDSKIPSPQAFWVRVNKAVLPRGSSWPYGESDWMLCFGTRTIINARTLKQEHSVEIAQKLLRWDSCHSCGVFDEALANDDRHVNNILTNGKGFWLIDHGRTFAHAYREPKSLLTNTSPLFSNMFLEIIAEEKLSVRMKLREKVNAACGKVIASINALPLDELVKDPDLSDGIRHFLNSRSENLIENCMKRLGLDELKLN